MDRNKIKSTLPLFFLLSSMSILSPSLYAAVPNTDNPKTFVGPYGRLGFTTSVTGSSAVSVAGEAGPRNYRIGGTVGFTDMGSNRFKISAEYLWQKINFGFFSGNSYEWVSQGALGAEYQYLFEDYAYNPQIGINAYISRAPSDNLTPISGAFTNQNGTTQSYTDARRIAGSNAYGVSPGFDVQLWDGGKIGAKVAYDNVRYKTIYSRKYAKGVGGMAHISQMIADYAELGLNAEVRRPYNNYEATLAITTPTSYGTWLFGINGAYTIGKKTLPTTYNVGISADYMMDPTDEMGANQRQASESFLGWVAKPAVRMPQVLAVAEDGVCIPPAFIGQIGEFNGVGFEIFTPLAATSIASNYTGTNLVYSLDLNGNANAGSFTVTRNGIISASSGVTRSGLSITATNACGSATSNQFDLTTSS